MSTTAGPSSPLVLVVDDDPDFQEMLTHTLKKRGFRVLTALDSETAMATCREHAGAIDAMLADLSLPGDLTGGLARRVAAEFPGITTVFVTGIPRYIALGSGLVPPDAPYLEKPVSPDTLAGLLRTLLARRAAPG
ncbi:response regulator [Paractinoplanes maris]|uniref:response regulator n=1 Tax=Paractinoplanes maris TaxID=1734446 RepID=UPI0020226B0C|nr:response regulator [Actinoplanes maris]